jgi:hypothetical protein
MTSIRRRLAALERRVIQPDPALERESAVVEAILESRRRRGCEPIEPYPPGSFAGCYTVADRILRARQLSMERMERDGLQSELPSQESETE